jgi:hypothetical protein
VCSGKKCIVPPSCSLTYRLLARVLKEGVQFWYNETPTVKRGGGGGGGGGWGSRRCSSGKPLKFMLLHVSICSKLVRNLSNTLGFASLCRYASLLYYTTFSFSQVHYQIDQNVKCIIIMRIEDISFQVYRKPPTISPGLIYFRKRFLMGSLIQGGGGLIYRGANTWTIFCVSNKQVRHKQVSHKQENKHVLTTCFDSHSRL